MRATLMALVLASGTPALADPLPMYVRAIPAQVETPAPREQKPFVVRTAIGEPDTQRLPEQVSRSPNPSLMEELRDWVYSELPAVSIAVIAPLPVSSANGTIAGVGVLGKF